MLINEKARYETINSVIKATLDKRSNIWQQNANVVVVVAVVVKNKNHAGKKRYKETVSNLNASELLAVLNNSRLSTYERFAVELIELLKIIEK